MGEQIQAELLERFTQQAKKVLGSADGLEVDIQPDPLAAVQVWEARSNDVGLRITMPYPPMFMEVLREIAPERYNELYAINQAGGSQLLHEFRGVYAALYQRLYNEAWSQFQAAYDARVDEWRRRLSHAIDDITL